MSQTCDLQKRFTISEVAADWHEQIGILRRIMRPSIACTSEQLDPSPQSATLGFHHAAWFAGYYLFLISMRVGG